MCINITSTSVIILVVHYLGIATFEPECPTPVPVNCDRADPDASSVELMQSQTGQIQVFDVRCRIQPAEVESKSFLRGRPEYIQCCQDLKNLARPLCPMLRIIFNCIA